MKMKRTETYDALNKFYKCSVI